MLTQTSNKEKKKGQWENGLFRVKPICILQTIEANTIISYKQKKKKKPKKYVPLLFSHQPQRGKTKANRVQAKTIHFSQNPNANHKSDK